MFSLLLDIMWLFISSTCFCDFLLMMDYKLELQMEISHPPISCLLAGLFYCSNRNESLTHYLWILISNIWGFCLCQQLFYLSFYYYTCSIEWEILVHCGFDLYFPEYKMTMSIFSCLLAICVSSLETYIFKHFIHVWVRLFLLLLT